MSDEAQDETTGDKALWNASGGDIALFEDCLLLLN